MSRCPSYLVNRILRLHPGQTWQQGIMWTTVDPFPWQPHQHSSNGSRWFPMTNGTAMVLNCKATANLLTIGSG